MTTAIDHDIRPRGRPVKSDDERDAMKKRITETARQMFQEEGYAKVSMRRLAKQVGCSPMTLYKYYDGKIAILQTLWGFVFDDIYERLNGQSRNVSEPKERLRTLCRAYVGYWIEHQDHYRLVFMTEGITQPEVSMFIGTPEIAACIGLLAEAVTGCAKAVGSDHANKIKIDLLISSLHGISLNIITISGYPWSDAEQMIDHLVASIA